MDLRQQIPRVRVMDQDLRQPQIQIPTPQQLSTGPVESSLPQQTIP